MKGRFVCMWNCLIFFLGGYSSVWREICPFLSQIQSRFLRGISGKNYFRTILWKTKVISSSKICEISPYFLQFYFVLKNCVEKFTQVLSCAVCTLRRRHVHKQNTKRRYREKSQDIFFSENQSCSFSVWVLLRHFPWVFWSENFTRHSSFCVLSLGWDLSSRYVPQDFQ